MAIGLLVLLGSFGCSGGQSIDNAVSVEAGDLCNTANFDKPVVVEGYLMLDSDVKCVSKNQGNKNCMLEFVAKTDKFFSVYLREGGNGANMVQVPKDQDSDFVLTDFERKPLQNDDKIRITGILTKATDEHTKSYPNIFKGCFLDSVRVERAVLSEAELLEKDVKKKKQSAQLAVMAKFVVDNPKLGIKKFEMHPRHENVMLIYLTGENSREVAFVIDRPKGQPLVDSDITQVIIYDGRGGSLSMGITNRNSMIY